MPRTAVVPIAMSVAKPLLAVLTVLLVAGGGAAATGLAQTDTGASSASVSDLEMDATLHGGSVMVTMTDDGAPVENASITVEGETGVTVTTDADGTATVNRTALTEADESLEELEIEYESDHAEGELEYVVEDGTLTLVEEEYEYEVEEADGEDEVDDDGSEADDEREEDDEDERDEDEEEEEGDDDGTEEDA
jgi:hypothetical protein